MSSCGCDKPKCPSTSGGDKKGDASACGTNLFKFVCGDKCGAKEEECGPKCPPMPCFDTSNCKPQWLCAPPQITGPQYAAPEGVEIVPISVGGRFGSSGGGGARKAEKCGSCGSVAEARCGAPKVGNSDCPMMRPRCPGTEKKGGFLDKIKAWFSGKK